MHLQKARDLWLLLKPGLRPWAWTLKNLDLKKIRH